jgi:hypothetical protein
MKKLLQNALMICGLASGPAALPQAPAQANQEGFDYKGYHFASAMWPFFEHDNIILTPLVREEGDTLMLKAVADTANLKECCRGACCEMHHVQMSMVFEYLGPNGRYGPKDISELYSQNGNQHIVITNSRVSGDGRVMMFRDGCPARATVPIPSNDIPRQFVAHCMGIGGMNCQ